MAEEKPESTGWIWMRLTGEGVPEDVAPVRFPDDESVIEHHEARGWVRVDDPADEPFIPASTDVPDDQPWIELVHPDIPGAWQSVPNDPAAVQGQLDVGWRRRDDPPDDAPDQSDEESGEDSGKPKRAKKTSSSRPAADDQDEQKG